MDASRSKQLQNVHDRLSRWESALAPLTDLQKKGYMELSAVASARPLPASLLLESGGHSSMRKEEPVTQDTTSTSEKIKLGLEKVDDSHKFLEWFDEVESQVQAEREKCYRDYCAQSKEYQDKCTAMLSEVDHALEFLREMRDKHSLVSQKTGALHQACEQLVEEQTKLIDVAESINSKLSYFTELEHISSRLNSSTLSVTSESFVGTLTRIDDCVNFIEQHPHYKESQVYLVRFKQYLSKALNLVKQHVVTSIRNTTKSVMPKQNTVPVSTEGTYAQLYGKFRTNAPRIKVLMKEIEERADMAAEYGTLLRDCHQCYISQRGILLTPIVSATTDELKKVHSTDPCGLVRSGCSYLCRVCQDEYQLFFHFFTTKSQQLIGLLESLSFSLYDILRPVIIHTNHLETLTDLCTILKVEMLEERVEPKGSELNAFGGVVKQMLEDAQQRLVFRAQRFIQTDIRGYKPAPGDLAYPDKLIVASEATQGDTSIGLSDSDSVFDISGTEESDTPPTDGEIRTKSQTRKRQSRTKKMAAVDMHAMWYPTVRRTLLCLSKLYRCIEKPVFEGVAPEALSECVNSLHFASNAITAKKLPVDAQLFLIKHLLILREQIAAFDVDFTVTEVSLDWTRTRDAAYSLLHKKSRMFSLSGNNSILEFFIEGAPDIVEIHVDSKKEVDKQLKLVCEKFISNVTASLGDPLKALLLKIDVIFEMASKDNLDAQSLLQQQPFTTAGEVHKVVTETNQLLKSRVPSIKESLALYLANEETEHILFRPCRVSILQSFENLEKIIKQNYSDDDQLIISCPSQDEVSLMLALPPQKRF